MSSSLSPAVESQVKRILDAAARRILAELTPTKKDRPGGYSGPVRNSGRHPECQILPEAQNAASTS